MQNVLYAVLLAVRWALGLGDPEVCLYTDSWTGAQGLATWMGHSRAQDWTELYSSAQDLLIYVFHVDAHQNRTQEHCWNAATDQLAHIAECTVAPANEREALSLLASWIHTHSGHLGQEGAYHWAQAQGIPTSHVALKAAKAVCKICQIVKPLQVEAGSPGQVPRGDQPAQIWQVDYVSHRSQYGHRLWRGLAGIPC
uniref:RNase H type-1 domain-containing protein n=1 Tax=Chrysemys picta bellii TaxID=8478 RepID=A0A8C3IJP5_CHRPI